ncbi:hypothetical protein A2773_03495 [Candidatus Gottesmanbacteria bacterium RIFCSPHIGHO2_01_FULL_39_10]|uniref:Methyltransferase type 11 domain-containing protein n=1 Tax=Candidatus Gottesmanbacteria bacterium RIFCSPHIGHO2_01_FULL_39_10 TaxID=1798375 RepID=A0A1F5ZPA5_9BACT|nr:MAG: hypothetical protein A2773_03495 [Candidatus Gottesmanbacteria bacterium RIFCSPHIGHO2_01_FULL_39_10]
MELYKKEDKEIIFQTQNRDPFFNYLTEIIVSFIDKKKGRVLDLGCGAGRNVLAAARLGLEVVGVDANQKSLEIARDFVGQMRLSGRTKFVKTNITKLRPKQFGMFDYVILQEVIEHVEDYQSLIDFAYSSLKKGGKILITTPNDPKQWNLLDDYAEHVRRFKLNEVEKALKEFKKIKIFTIGFPFHRMVITLYNQLLKLRKRHHEAKSFRKNKIFHGFYYLVGTIFLRLDDLFRFTPWGTTIVAIGEK